ncbi:hypothetical protein GCM10020254_28070 [Streptomyces goshikiensis]
MLRVGRGCWMRCGAPGGVGGRLVLLRLLGYGRCLLGGLLFAALLTEPVRLQRVEDGAAGLTGALGRRQRLRHPRGLRTRGRYGGVAAAGLGRLALLAAGAADTGTAGPGGRVVRAGELAGRRGVGGAAARLRTLELPGGGGGVQGTPAHVGTLELAGRTAVVRGWGAAGR